MPFYFLLIALQVFCLVHAIRNSRDRMWVYILIFLPLVGALAYFILEIIPELGRKGEVVETAVNAFDPGHKIRSLEANLRLSETHANRERLADAYQEAGQYEKAIMQYRKCLYGMFADDPVLLQKLMKAYFYADEYEKAIEIGEQVKEFKGRFPQEASQLIFAHSLKKAGLLQAAKEEFQKTFDHFQSLEACYFLGVMSREEGDLQRAAEAFRRVLQEGQDLPRQLLRPYRKWMHRSQEALNEL
ncbi:MAG: hypothetical protein AAFV95_15885 [Bacteroidota bacterium]